MCDSLYYGFFSLTFIGIISAPLWDSKTSTFAGLLTTADYLNLIQYYWQNPEAVNRIDQFKLSSLRGEFYHLKAGSSDIDLSYLQR